jgi:hypothetical protein
MNQGFISRSSFETVQQLIALGRTNAAVEVLRLQRPAAAYKMNQELLLSGKIGGPQAITLISQSIPSEHWDELGIQSIGDRP